MTGSCGPVFYWFLTGVILRLSLELSPLVTKGDSSSDKNPFFEKMSLKVSPLAAKSDKSSDIITGFESTLRY